MSAEFLSAADDFLTRLLFDLIIFADPVLERITGKMNPTAPRIEISSKDLKIVSNIFDDLRDTDMDITDAWNLLEKTECTQKFKKQWKGNERNLEIHARRYFSAFVPETGIAFRETDRYTNPIKTARNYPSPSPTPPPAASAVNPFLDVAVFATRDFEKGDIIQLKGGLGALTEEEDDALRSDGQRKDFSVIYTSRKNCFSLLLGPSRFVNHDCRNNVKFYQTGKNMSFEVIEDIAADEEIFTNYGSEYFENSNAACLCATCQKLQRGAFSPAISTEVQSGHQVTAARNIKPTAKPPLKPTKSNEELLLTATRRSDRLVEVVDVLREGKRIVHPQLPPPKGYKAHYRWNQIKKTAHFIGPTGAPDSTDEEEEDSESEEDSSSEEELAPTRPRGTAVKRVELKKGKVDKWVTDDEESDQNSTAAESDESSEDEVVAPPKKRKFAALPQPKKLIVKKPKIIKIPVKLYNDEEEEEEEEKKEIRSHSRSTRASMLNQTPDSIDGDPMTPALDSDDGEDFQSGNEWGRDSFLFFNSTRSSSPCSSVDDEEYDVGEEYVDKPNSNDPLPEKSGEKDDEEMNQLPSNGGSGSGGSAGDIGSAGGGSGSKDEDEQEKKKKVIDIAVEEEIVELEERIKKEELMEDTEDVHRDDEEHEAATLMLLFSQPTFSHHAPTGPPSATSSDLSSTGSTTTIDAIPDPVRPPSTKSTSSSSTRSDSLSLSRTEPPSTTRLARKKSKTKTPRQSSPNPPTSKPKKGSNSTAIARTSSPRSTRSNDPIKLDLAQLLRSSAVTNVTGGFDSTTGKYYTDRAVASASPIVIATPPKEIVKKGKGKGKASPGKKLEVSDEKEGEKRSTRSSLPIKGDLRSVLNSEKVLLAVGGFDSETKKYTSRK